MDRPLPLTRRSVLAGAAALAAPAAWAQAGDYPSRPVRVLVAFTAGGTTDVLARAVTQKLSDRLKQSFVIDNKPGGGGNIGTEMAARSAPDGYTLIVNSVGPMAVNPTLYPKLNINPLVDLVPVVQIADVPNVLVVNPSVPAKTVDEFVAYAKTKPGQLNYGSTGIGTSSHLSGYMLGKRAGIETTHVPYRGAEALNDLLAGRIQFMFATIPSVIQHIQAGKLRAIAVTSVKRSRSMPDVPTVAERGYPGFEAGSWFGVFAPKGTPEAVIATLNKAVNEALPSLEAQMVREGADPVGGSAAQLGQFVQKEYEKWRTVVRESGATAE
ncbi:MULTISPECIES: Bug family tripartite tricarboxylate transporter substrate binding protein [Ramlibacter]|uniref:Tripartite tricarboxylate transporter substrate binding protein n=1 Tax=Ramlibacter pinisoli TaxID=2682844 RepID=A0A6N8IW24_9BURK|nr:MULTISPECIES: tripartite tricarboxylate transporter substrate binding protein [Ramlibacter]MBA2961043.1 tripartite tricarboxylate transporter substrate binding protein [Ramlibacter sp. CGMCC 1.13660]MVQ30988.1 tripartite tricarboxylate transporter substrate binding protein [Ramlibacter pinisoli]